MKKMFKKLVSMLVISCFMISIINLPAYSAISELETIGNTQIQEEYTGDYVSVNAASQTDSKAKPKATTKTSKPKATTVSSAVKKVANQAVNAVNKLLKKKGISKLAKTWLKKVKTLINSIKNGTKSNKDKQSLLNKALTAINKVAKAKGSELSLAQQTVSLGSVFSALKNVVKNNITYKIYAKYAKAGVDVIKALAKKVGLKATTVYSAFTKMGVTKAQIKKVGSLVIKLMKKGEKFINCAANSVARYLGISKASAAVQNLAADISIDADRFLSSNKNGFVGTYTDAELKTLQKNGHKNAKTLGCTLSKFMSSLKVGERAILHLKSYNTKGKKVGGHAIVVVREKSGYSVYNNLINGGKKITYSSAEFKKLVNGKSATGKTASGKKIKSPVYYNTTSGKHSYKAIENGNMRVTTDSKDLTKEEVVYNNNNTGITITYKTSADTATKPKATKKVSLTSKIVAKYTNKGLTTLKALANKFKLKLSTVYNQFVKYGVTKAQMKKVASGLLKMIKRGADFCVCSTTAVSKYLGIGKYFTAVQQIAAEISLNYFDPNEKSHYIATTWTAQTKVLSKNGVKNSEGYNVKLADFLSMKKGTKMLVNVDCYTTSGKPNGCHAITITREKNGKYGVYDVLVNGGNKVIYTKAQIKRLLAGKSAKGKTTSGRTITKKKYLASAYGSLSYKFVNNGTMRIYGNSSKIVGSDTRNKYNQNISIINNLLKKKGLNSLVKTWLIKAKTTIKNVLNSSKSDSDKYYSMWTANSLLGDVKKAGATLLSVIKSSTSNFYKFFTPLKSILKNNLTYKMYNKYGEGGIKAISAIAKKFGLSQSTVYNIFVNNKVTKSQMDLISDSIIYSLKDGDFFSWQYAYSSVNNSMAAIKKLVDNKNAPTSVKPKATTTKPKATKTASLTSQIVKKYTKQGLTTLKAFAKKLGLKLKTVYNQFVKYGVTKAQMKKVASGLLKMIKRGANFTGICSTLAVSKYLGISKAFTAVQQIAAEISLNYFDPKSKKQYIATTGAAQAKVLSKNGVKNSEEYSVKLADLLSMKKGTKLFVTTACYNRSGRQVSPHAITVVREKNGKFGVYDVLINGGNKITYTKAQFKRLMNGQSAKGKTASGRTITKSKYLASTVGAIRYKFVNNGGVSVVGDSTKIVGQYTKDSYKESISIINKLLKKSNLSNVAKTWLKKAKEIVNKVYKSNKKDSIKMDSLNGATYWLRNIKAGGATVASIKNAYRGFSVIAPIFNSLESIVNGNSTSKNDTESKIETKYGDNGVNLINKISDKYNLNKTAVYNAFVNSGVTKTQMEDNAYVLSYQIGTGEDIFSDPWVSDNNIIKALVAIKKLVDNQTASLAA